MTDTHIPNTARVAVLAGAGLTPVRTDVTAPEAAPSLRPAGEVMGLERAGAVVASPLSFARAAMRELVRGRWRIEKLRFDLDDEGRGEILYRLVGGSWVFHFFLISNKLPEDQKTDRNYAASWDAMGVMCQGEWTAQREAWLRREVPKQRSGHADYDTLVYARGNRSARLFEHVVGSLAAGRQPDAMELAPIGYILRTTAFIGNGQLGTRPYAGLEPNHPMRRPYHVQFVSGFLLREFVFDLVDHLARVRNPRAVRLSPAYRRFLGLGNSAATGLVPFVVNHPHLMHRWCLSYEQVLAQALARPAAPTDAVVRDFLAWLDKAIDHHREGLRPSDTVFPTTDVIVTDLQRVRTQLQAYEERGEIDAQATTRPWQALSRWARPRLHAESREVLHALVLEVHPDLVESVRDTFTTQELFEVHPAMAQGELRELVRAHYDWALDPALRAQSPHYFWYRTTKAPRDVRRALRGRAPDLEREGTTDTVLQVQRLWDALEPSTAAIPVARLLCARPDLRHIVARVQSLAGLDYAELRAHWLAQDFSPFAPVRFVLHFFGMEKFEAAFPKSVRGTFMQGAPIAQDVCAGRDGDWPYPLIPQGTDSAPVDPGAPVVPLDGPDPTAGRRLEAIDPPQRVMSPRELVRMAWNAMLGYGTPLGLAEEAAELVVFAQSCGEAALERLLEDARQGRLGRGPVQPQTHEGGALDVLQAHGGAAPVWVPDAVDLACARAATSPGQVGRALVLDVHTVQDVAQAARVCAQRDVIALLLWSSLDACGWALAGPGRDGPWLLQGQLPSTPSALAQLLAQIGAGPAIDLPMCPADPDDAVRRLHAALAPTATRPDGVGQVLVSCRAARGGADGQALFDALTRDAGQAPPGMRMARDAQALRAHEQQGLRQGIVLARETLDALAGAGATALVPHEQEHRMLPEGFDPLKGF